MRCTLLEEVVDEGLRSGLRRSTLAERRWALALATQIREAMNEQGLVDQDLIDAGCKPIQVAKLLGDNIEQSATLRTIFIALERLGLILEPPITQPDQRRTQR